MKKIKSLIARTIKNIGKLTAFCCLLLPAFAICCLLGSWTIDNNGNLVGDNILDVSNFETITTSTIEIKQENQTLIFNGTATSTIGIATVGAINLYNEQGFTGQLFYKEGSITNGGIELFWASSENLYYISTYKTTDNYRTNYSRYNENSATIIRVAFIIYENTTFVNYKINLSLTIGNNILQQFEPYGTYYSQNNYNNMYDERYNEGYNDGYSIGYNKATTDVITQYAVPLIQAYQIQQVVIHAENANNQDLGRVNFTESEDEENNTLELSNINTLSGSTKNVIMIYLVNNVQITEFKATEGFTAVYLGNQSYTASYDGTNYIIYPGDLINSQVVNVIRIEIPLSIRAVNYQIKGSNLSIEGTKNAYESGKEIGKQQQADEDQAIINQLETQYDTLLEHYQTAQMENPLSKMVIAVADIPLNLFHSMFNFDIMGFNLSAFILGIITILLVAYVIKLFL